jgi:hypothetical protein
MFVFGSTFAETFLVLHFRQELRFEFQLDLQLRSPLVRLFHCLVEYLYRSDFEWLDIRHIHLIACFDSFQFARVKLFKK